jgi:hypothetical protein
MSTSMPGSVATTSPGTNGASNNNNGGSPPLDAMSSLPPDVSRKTLESTVERAMALLRGIAAEKGIREQMHKYGYSDAHQQEGWRRLAVAAGFHQPLGAQDDNDANVRNAINELDSSDEQVFRIAAASLSRRFPQHADRLLGGISASRGVASVLNLEILLDRIDKLEQDASDSQRTAVVTLLSERGLSPAERARLRGLINVAKKSNPVDGSPSAVEERDKQYVANLQALREWYEEWSEIARALFSRRDYLIRLGMAASRRSSKEEEEPAPPVAPSPVEPGV